jgi:hypothetical protein
MDFSRILLGRIHYTGLRQQHVRRHRLLACRLHYIIGPNWVHPLEEALPVLSIAFGIALIESNARSARPSQSGSPKRRRDFSRFRADSFR